MWDEDMNTAIDEVARQMTEETPPAAADFRRRVLGRIPSNEAAHASRRAAFVLSPIAVAAAIAIALFVASRPDPVRPGSQSAGNTVRPFDGAQGRPEALEGRLKPDTTEAAGPTGPALQAAAANTVRLKPDTTEVRRPGPFGPSVSSRPGSFGPDVLEPALQVDSIAVAPLVAGVFAPDPIQIERLDAVAPIGVAPLETVTDMQRRQE
jgi:hypothetical protein